MKMASRIEWTRKLTLLSSDYAALSQTPDHGQRSREVQHIGGMANLRCDVGDSLADTSRCAEVLPDGEGVSPKGSGTSAQAALLGDSWIHGKESALSPRSKGGLDLFD